MSTSSSSWLLPDPRRRGEIQFELAKGLPYAWRLAIILCLLAVGFVLQATVSLLVGAAFLLAATLLAIVRGFSNAPEDVGQTAEWRGATREQYENVLRIARQSRKWDQSALDVTCGTGVALLLVVAAVVAVVAHELWINGEEWLATAWAIDAAVLLVPHWVTGVRRILTNAPLTIKTDLLLTIVGLWESDRRDGETVYLQMQVSKGPQGEVPCDAKLVIRFADLGDAFLGLQVQVTLNRVQGHDYPYLYCVLVARPAMQMAESLQCRPPDGIVVETDRKSADDVEILVIRQETTANSGYHTDAAACRAIFQYALHQCHRLESASANKKT